MRLSSVPFRQHIEHERRFPGTRYAGYANEATDGEPYCQVLQVMLRRLPHFDEITGPFAEKFARFSFAVQVGAGYGRRLTLQLLQRSRSDDFAPVFPGSRTDIDQVVRGLHDSCVMFDDEHRIVFVPQ
ncbi:hypothetical protein SDC9_124844 [bioreactor metagenome]|uniref:Uncharacterized protein n=1 Tax=bioreactor metagenome TaxID=1076179 RepID=A0A645CLH8_9ZZZZ